MPLGVCEPLAVATWELDGVSVGLAELDGVPDMEGVPDSLPDLLTLIVGVSEAVEEAEPDGVGVTDADCDGVSR